MTCEPCDDCPNLPVDARRLNPRRLNVTFQFEALGHDLIGTVGFDTPDVLDPATWRERELFITGPKEGTGLLSLLQTSCVMASHLLQQSYGPDDFDALRDSLHGRRGDRDNAFHVALLEASHLVRDVRSGKIDPTAPVMHPGEQAARDAGA